MNQSHIIDSWIAELGLSGRTARRAQASALPQAGAESARTVPEAETLLARPGYRLRPRYQVISSPC